MPNHIDRNLIQFLVVILFFAGGAIMNWLKRRGQSEEHPETSSERTAPPPPRGTGQTTPAAPSSAPRPTPRKIDWEAELRRMLGEPQTAPPPLPPQPSRYEPRPATPPRAITPPVHPLPRPAPIRPVMAEPERGLPVEFAGLTASAQSYAQASQLDVQVTEHLRQISQQVKQHRGPKQTTAASLGVAQTLALLRNRQSLRSVIMASMILGPPKALGG